MTIEHILSIDSHHMIAKQREGASSGSPSGEQEIKETHKEQCLKLLKRTIHSLEEDLSRGVLKMTPDFDTAVLGLPQIPEHIRRQCSTSHYHYNDLEMTDGLEFLKALTRLVTHLEEAPNSTSQVTEESFTLTLRASWLFIDWENKIMDDAVFRIVGSNMNEFGKKGKINLEYQGNWLREAPFARNTIATRKCMKEVIDRLIQEEPCTREQIFAWKREELFVASECRVEIADQLAKRYNALTKTVRTYSQTAGLLQEGIRAGFDVKEVMRQDSSPEIRFLLRTFRDTTPRVAYKEMREQLEASDADRWALHRKIEAFYHVFLNGMNTRQTRKYIEYEQLKEEFGTRTITEGIEGTLVKSSMIGFLDVGFKIILGEGEDMTGSPDSDTPAPAPPYESLVSPDRTIEEDHDLAEAITQAIKTMFPYVLTRNNVEVTGSFHVQCAQHELWIITSSLIEQSCALDISIEELLERIYPIVAEVIEKERKKYHTYKEE